MWFIDTSVLANWIISKSGSTEYLFNALGIGFEHISNYNNKHKDSIDFINKIINLNENDPSYHDEYYITYLTIDELFSSVKDEINSIMLFKEGEPISRWRDPRNLKPIKEEHFKEIYTLTMSTLDKLLADDSRITLTPDRSFRDKEFLGIYARILFLMKDARTQDSVLLATAVLNGADYFVSRDGKIKRNYKQSILPGSQMHVIEPENGLRLLNKMNGENSRKSEVT